MSAVYRFTVLTMLAPALVFGLSVPIAIVLDPGDARLFWVVLVIVNPMIGIAANRAWTTQAEKVLVFSSVGELVERGAGCPEIALVTPSPIRNTRRCVSSRPVLPWSRARRRVVRLL